ncbi:PEPxxWA-CTERM sorting domain-containing protein [Rhodocyclus tenuis]|uniref:PEPxxWA-CTERM sorting domain-containing protein n=2 Tax=Rhodocyclus TaxID=1064 RepID=A0A6L5JWN0_RHOTE|nr:FxDxF family PEP-CTERM protein [Rhodocyclus gracilis]MQY51024.1 PEPxxWA-CTERM sorting domain-containing protein [Rhodocyclus gracilis]NJA88734.1 PEPxxWA-CTERM sorting domain-containing protein [Rhodocyclus gracilis]
MTHSLRKKAVGVAVMLGLAAASLAPLQASATTYDLGVNPSFADTVTYKVKGTFEDLFTFTLNPAADLAAQGVALNFTKFSNITGGTFQLFSGIPGSKQATSIGTSVSLNNIEHDYFKLSSGDYFFNVRGKVDGTGGGSYIFSLVATPVPEPGEWALLLSGLGLIGTMIRRRSRSLGA